MFTILKFLNEHACCTFIGEKTDDAIIIEFFPIAVSTSIIMISRIKWPTTPDAFWFSNKIEFFITVATEICLFLAEICLTIDTLQFEKKAKHFKKALCNKLLHNS